MRCLHLLIRWIVSNELPADASGQEFYPKWTNHFQPSSLIFDARHRHQVLLSDAGLLVVLAGLAVIFRPYGFGAMVKYYGAFSRDAVARSGR